MPLLEQTAEAALAKAFVEARLWQSQALQKQRESLEQVVAELEQQKAQANAAVARHWELKQQTKRTPTDGAGPEVRCIGHKPPLLPLAPSPPLTGRELFAQVKQRARNREAWACRLAILAVAAVCVWVVYDTWIAAPLSQWWAGTSWGAPDPRPLPTADGR